LIADVKDRVANDKEWIDGFAPHPAKYLVDERWEDEVTVTPTKAFKLPRADNQLQEWARNHGLREARVGESYPEYRSALGLLL
jgi:hypothetical protein